MKRLSVQALERRQLLAGDVGMVDSTLHIEGTSQNDIAEVYVSEESLVVKLQSQNAAGEGTDAQEHSFPADQVDRIVFEAFGGDDLMVNDTSINSVMRGGGGHDTLMGGEGNDLLIAGAGDDLVLGGGGDDVVLGGVGTDLLIESSPDDGGDEPLTNDDPVVEDAIDEPETVSAETPEVTDDASNATDETADDSEPEIEDDIVEPTNEAPIAEELQPEVLPEANDGETADETDGVAEATDDMLLETDPNADIEADAGQSCAEPFPTDFSEGDNAEPDGGTFELLVEDVATEPVLNDPEPTVPEPTEPELSDPEMTESAELETMEPELADPVPNEPEVTEPSNVEPEFTEPELTEPELTEPEFTEPELTEPESQEPEPAEPELTEPEMSEPELTEPEIAEPEVTDPEDLDPENTNLESTDPVMNEPESGEPSGDDAGTATPEVTTELLDSDVMPTGDGTGGGASESDDEPITPVEEPVNDAGETVNDAQEPVNNTEEPVAESDDDVLFGGEGNDWLFGEAGEDTVFGGDSPLGDALLEQMLQDRLA
ncbi:MAG: hypothetical protein AAFX06_16810 [Planctomycetota bacterium]